MYPVTHTDFPVPVTSVTARGPPGTRKLSSWHLCQTGKHCIPSRNWGTQWWGTSLWSRGEALCRARIKLLLTSSWPRFQLDFPKFHRELSKVLNWRRAIRAAPVEMTGQDFSAGEIKGGLKILYFPAFPLLLLCLFYFRRRFSSAVAWKSTGYLGCKHLHCLNRPSDPGTDLFCPCWSGFG